MRAIGMWHAETKPQKLLADFLLTMSFVTLSALSFITVTNTLSYVLDMSVSIAQNRLIQKRTTALMIN